MGWLDLVPNAPTRRSSWLDDVPDANPLDQDRELLKKKKLAQLDLARALGDKQAGELGIGAESNTPEYIWSSIKEYTGGPFVGLAERANLVPEGTRAGIREENLREREKFLNAHPSTGGAVASYGIDVLGNVPGLLIPGGAGKAAAKAGLAMGASKTGAKVLGALAGATESTALTLGDTVDRPVGEQVVASAIGFPLGLIGGRMSAGAEIKGKAPSLLRKAFDATGGQPDFVLAQKAAAKGAVEMADFQLGRKMDDVEAEIRKITGMFGGKERAELDGLIRKSLEGDKAAFDLLPDHLQKPVSEIRAHQDMMSQKFISTMMGGDQNASMLHAALGSGAEPKALSELIGATDSEKIAGALDAIPEPARAAATALKESIEGMNPWRRETAKKFASSAATFDFNMGKYLNRSYRGFSDPRYAAELAKKGQQSWRYADFTKWYQSEFGKSAEEADVAARGLISQMENLFANPRPNELRGNSLLPPINLDALKRRGDISPEVQAFLGLETNWNESIRRGSLKAATMANFTEAYNSMLDEGVKRGLFEVVPEGLANTPQNHALSATLGPSGKFNLPPGLVVKTTPEINAALTHAEKVAEDGWFQAINAIFNANLTKRSIGTSARNVISNPIIAMATGHGWEVAKTYHQSMADIAKVDLVRELGGVPVYNSKTFDLDSELIKRGVYEMGGAIGDVSAGLGKLTKRGGLLDRGPSEFVGAQTAGDKFKEAIRSVARKEEKLTTVAYHTPDAGLRRSTAIAIFKQLADIYGTSKTTSELLDMAAERSKAKVPTPSHSYPIVNWIRKNVPVGPFAMFPAEILRATINNLDIARKDVVEGFTTGNTKLAMYGYKQFASVLGTMGFLAAMPSAIRMAAGAGTETKEREDAARHMAPSFYENSQIVLLPSDNPDQMRYMDFGGLNPFGVLFQPAAAMMSSMHANDGIFEATLAGMKEFAEPFISAKIPVQAAEELYANKKTSYAGGVGSEIYNESETGIEKAKSIGNYLAKSGLFPRYVSQIGKAVDAVRAGDSDELKRLLGVTIRTESVSKAMENRARFQHFKEYAGTKKIVSKITGKATRENSRPDPTALAEAKARANQQWTERGYKPLQQDIQAMRTWGKTDAEIFRILTNDTGLPHYIVRGAIMGQNVGLQF